MKTEKFPRCPFFLCECLQEGCSSFYRHDVQLTKDGEDFIPSYDISKIQKRTEKLPLPGTHPDENRSIEITRYYAVNIPFCRVQDIELPVYTIYPTTESGVYRIEDLYAEDIFPEFDITEYYGQRGA